MAYLIFFVFATVNHLPFKEGIKHCLGRQYIITTFETEKRLAKEVGTTTTTTNDSTKQTLFECSTKYYARKSISFLIHLILKNMLAFIGF